jgi:hypothetical protein
MGAPFFRARQEHETTPKTMPPWGGLARRKDANQVRQPAIPYDIALSYMLNYRARMGVSGVFAREVFGKNFPAVRAYQFEA